MLFRRTKDDRERGGYGNEDPAAVSLAAVPLPELAAECNRRGLAIVSAQQLLEYISLQGQLENAIDLAARGMIYRCERELADD